MSKIAEMVMEASEVGCCLTRMNMCQCHRHINEACNLIGASLRAILVAPDAAEKLIKFIDQLERAR